VAADRGIDRQSGQKSAYNAWQIDEIRKHAGHRHDAEHRDAGLAVLGAIDVGKTPYCHTCGEAGPFTLRVPAAGMAHT
jgi:hypothetical protein